MLNVFDLHFSTPEEKAVSRICASKTRRNLQTFGWCLHSNSHACGLHYLTFVCGNKAGKINALGRVVLSFKKSLALSILFEWGEVPLQIEFANICRQKTTKEGRGRSVTTSS
jgi:hypothetical protein